MKVLKQFNYTGEYEGKEYERTFVVTGDRNHYPKMVGVPKTDENYIGKDVEVVYKRFGKEFKAAGLKVI